MKTVGYVFRLLINVNKITHTVQNVIDKKGDIFPALIPFSKPTCLYGMETLKSEGTIFVVEGEKTVDAFKSIVPTAQVISWAMGTKSVRYADFNCLPKNRKYILIPDADYKNIHGTLTPKPFNEQLGHIAMQEVATRLPEPLKVRILNTSEMGAIKSGWDIADSNFTKEELKDWLLKTWKN